MSQRLRTFVFWLLALALPLQSFAAVTGGACTCMHLAKAAMAAAPVVAEHQMANHGAGGNTSDQSTDERCHSTAPSAPLDTSHCASDLHGADSDAPSDTSSCGACAGCCIVHAAIPVALFAAENTPAPRVSTLALRDLFTDHVTPTPKRPPRVFSA